jgi:5-(carboxyamino)imidazole ribonucleotide mutase
LVGIVMGSDSDLPVMEAAAKVLDRFGVPFELKICSAHRSLHAVLEYVKKAEARGIRVIIAGAGGAAHLAGVIAGQTTLPSSGAAGLQPSQRT